MSIVIAIKSKNKIYVGCDKQISTASGDKISLIGKCQKVWHFNELPDLVLGGAGSLRDLQIIQTSVSLFTPTEVVLETIDYNFMVQNFFTRVYDILTHFNRIDTEESKGIAVIPDSWLVAFKDKMWKVDSEGSVIESDDYLVIGSGETIATGVLESNKGKSPKERIIQAIKACNENTLYVDGNIYITSTDLEGKDDIHK